MGVSSSIWFLWFAVFDVDKHNFSHDNSLSDSELTALSAFGAASITRICSRLAYEKKGRALQASDLSVEVGNAFKLLFETEDPKL
jgi:ATP-dependent NAD(P)H-hydrate dehydratase